MSFLILYFVINNFINYYFTDDQIEGKTVTVIGWGSVKYGEEGPSRFLREVRLKILKNKKCLRDKVGKYIAEDLNTMFCASGKRKDACTVIILFYMF